MKTKDQKIEDIVAPIEKVHIEVAGDPSVGIRRQQFEASVFIERDLLRDGDLDAIRTMFEELYELMAGEPVGVMFDFEYAAMLESEVAP